MSEQPVDLGALARDDALLDALGRGVQPAPDDEFAAMLASWKADLSTDTDIADVDATAAEDTHEEMADPAPVSKPALARPGRAVLAAAAAVLALAGTLTVVAGAAEPGSPLWPITTVVYAERADSLVATQDARRAIAEAREAMATGRYAEAGRLLDKATTLAGQISDTGTRQQLLDEVAALQALLPAATPAPTTSRAQGTNTKPTPNPSPSSGASSGSHTGGGNSGRTPSPSSSPGGGLTGILPSLPLPTLPLPALPTL